MYVRVDNFIDVIRYHYVERFFSFTRGYYYLLSLDVPHENESYAIFCSLITQESPCLFHIRFILFRLPLYHNYIKAMFAFFSTLLQEALTVLWCLLALPTIFQYGRVRPECGEHSGQRNGAPDGRQRVNREMDSATASADNIGIYQKPHRACSSIYSSYFHHQFTLTAYPILPYVN